MPVVDFVQILSAAVRGSYAVGYFEAWDQYSLEAVLEVAEEKRSPVVLGFGAAVVNQDWLAGRGLEELAGLSRCLAERSTVPTAVLFNEARTIGQVRRALESGCNAVMLDCAHLPLPENVELTRRVVQVAHATGADVEGELGRLPDASEGQLVPAGCTDPAEASIYVAETGVDALSISVGNVHQLYGGGALIDLDLVERIHRAVPVPLVVHGGTGFPGEAVRPAIQRGIAKFNVGTVLKHAYLDGLRLAMAQLPQEPYVHGVLGSRDEADLLAQAKQAMKREIAARMEQYGCAGRANDRH